MQRLTIASLLAVLLISLPDVHASSILAFSVTTAASHHLQVIRIGQELIERGHNFTLLISSAEVNRHILDTAQARGCHIVEFRDDIPPMGSHASIRTVLRNVEMVTIILQAYGIPSYADLCTLLFWLRLA